MTKRYKLLKDLPGCKAGTVFELVSATNRDNYWAFKDADAKVEAPDMLQQILWGRDNDNEYLDWFEPLDAPTRWTPKEGVPYWYVDDDLVIQSNSFSLDGYGVERHAVNNCFRTKESAQAAAEAIKALLEYIHMPFNYENPKGHISAGREQVFEAARAAVSEGTE